MRRVTAQARIELLLTLRRGESVLLTFAIPVVLLAFFSKVATFATEAGEHRIDFIAPGVIALAIMSTAMVSLAIATGFERQTGVLKRLGSTPLTRPELLAAKVIAVLVVEVLQLVVLASEGFALGWRPDDVALVSGLVAMLLATVGFAGIGMLLAGSLPALTTLAAANGLYLVLVLVGGMIVPLSELPSGVRLLSRALPAGALSDATHGALGDGSVPASSWIVLALWAVVAPVLAAWRFRWE